MQFLPGHILILFVAMRERTDRQIDTRTHIRTDRQTLAGGIEKKGKVKKWDRTTSDAEKTKLLVLV